MVSARVILSFAKDLGANAWVILSFAKDLDGECAGHPELREGSRCISAMKGFLAKLEMTFLMDSRTLTKRSRDCILWAEAFYRKDVMGLFYLLAITLLVAFVAILSAMHLVCWLKRKYCQGETALCKFVMMFTCNSGRVACESHFKMALRAGLFALVIAIVITLTVHFAH